jgi:hypothetical protein
MTDGLDPHLVKVLLFLIHLVSVNTLTIFTMLEVVKTVPSALVEAADICYSELEILGDFCIQWLQLHSWARILS